MQQPEGRRTGRLVQHNRIHCLKKLFSISVVPDSALQRCRRDLALFAVCYHDAQTF